VASQKSPGLSHALQLADQISMCLTVVADFDSKLIQKKMSKSCTYLYASGFMNGEPNAWAT